MPKIKGYVVNIPRLYKHTSIDMVIFGYVQGMRYVLPTMSLTDAMIKCLSNLDISEDTYPLVNAITGYRRVLASLLEIEEGWVNDVDKIII